MGFVVEIIVALAIFPFVVSILNRYAKEQYTYEEYKDEDGNIVEKVIDHKDKGEN